MNTGYLFSVVEDHEGGLYFGGRNSDISKEAMILKTNAVGDFEWCNVSYGLHVSDIIYQDDESIFALEISASGSNLLEKLDRYGNSVWVKDLPFYPRKIISSHDLTSIIFLSYGAINSIDNKTNYNLTKIDGNGNILLQRQIKNTEGSPYFGGLKGLFNLAPKVGDIIETMDKKIVLVGCTYIYKSPPDQKIEFTYNYHSDSLQHLLFAKLDTDFNCGDITKPADFLLTNHNSYKENKEITLINNTILRSDTRILASSKLTNETTIYEYSGIVKN